MSGPEGFLSRWSRRKLESPKDEEFSPVRPARGERETKPSGREAIREVPAETGEPTSGAFDPASLPSIESIAADTDIRSFLRSGVPEELMRTALRRAWVTDPKVRDFIGIAENQWDFNDPGAMPGFGPLTAVDAAVALAGQIVGEADRVSRTIAASAAVPQDAPEAKPVGDDEPVAKLRQTGPEAKIAGLPEERNEEGLVERHDRAPGKNPARGYTRSHGGALPH
jgi:Protein of unknown function (DUF3306)